MADTKYNILAEVGVSVIANCKKEAIEKAKEALGMLAIQHIKVIADKRTGQQNDSLHLFLTQLAESLNEQGITLQQLLARSIEVYPTMENLKEDLWRPLQIKMFAKKSTTELAKLGEIDKIYESINKAMAFWGIHIPFPSKTDDENYLTN